MDLGQIQDTVNYALLDGHEAKMKDISYVVLENAYGSQKAAYFTLYGKDETMEEEEQDKAVKEYDQSELIECVRGYMISKKFIIPKNELRKKEAETEISADENKVGMVNLIKRYEEAMKNGEMSKKDGLAAIKDIRSRLQTRFELEQSNEQRHIIVNQKYNDICPYCNHEISIKKD